jgi:uncharacterized DUF497 family protein
VVRMHEEFEWDEDKAEANLRKHGVSFDEAASALADEHGDARHLDMDDPGHADGEDRYITHAPDPARPGVIYIISWTDRSTDEARVTRIISARKATKKERKFYEQELGG